ncbi:MAG: hypothetical protein Q8Q32_00915 [bacterium]|nr:hypothetical protein [bacterium]
MLDQWGRWVYFFAITVACVVLINLITGESPNPVQIVAFLAFGLLLVLHRIRTWHFARFIDRMRQELDEEG